MPALIGKGFPNCKTILFQEHPMYLPSLINQHSPVHYISQSELYGLPADVCPLPSFEAGLAIEDNRKVNAILRAQVSAGVGAINGLFEEGARRRGIPMCRVRQDLMDPTSITRREMRGDVNVFMQTVMNEEPLDASLVDFDDDESW